MMGPYFPQKLLLLAGLAGKGATPDEPATFVGWI
jgi:hypothetical protein